jgi:biopolymer transport protein ExbB
VPAGRASNIIQESKQGMGMGKGLRARVAKIAAGLAVALGLAAGLASPAFGWSDNQWSYRKEIVLDTTPSGAQVTGELRGFPVLIRLDSSNFTFDDAKADGSDIRFYASDDKTVLPFRIESFDAKAGLAAIWVSVADLAGSSQTKIYLYFGNKKAGVAPVSGPVFDPLYRGVYHFLAGSEAGRDDSGARADLSAVAVKSGGWIGSAAKFDGNATVTLPGDIAASTQGFTFEAWIKPRDAATGGTVYANGNLTLGLDKGAPYVEVAGQRSAPLAPLSGDWNHIALTVNGATVTLYVNGLPAATLATTAAAIPLLSGGGTLAGSPSSSPKFAGEIDEVRLSAAARSAPYVKAVYATAAAGGHLAHLGPTEQPADAGFGYFGVIFKSVTLDAWVVIAILVAMGVMSWVVMWTKGAYAGRTGRANHAFTAYYRNLNGNVLALTEESKLSKRDVAELQYSSLYRLYKVGAHELETRLTRLAGAPLAEENLEAIRATLDAALVDENRRLDKNMVLLTISIAGAPFIGLLGTVLGVMITFASIAAAGEVNVNAIAPGIAAALLATVAGLAVAIPALFGYNYIQSRNNTIAAETQIFGDQLLTRFAEWQHHVQTARGAAE